MKTPDKSKNIENIVETIENSSSNTPKDKDYCLATLYLILDGEATDKQTMQFKLHLCECFPNFNNYCLEAAVKEVLQKRIEKKCVPNDLVANIKAKIALEM